MSNDVQFNDNVLTVKLNSNVGDAIIVSALREIIDTNKGCIQHTIDVASDCGQIFPRHMEDIQRSCQVIAACEVLIDYMGADDV